MIEDFGQKIDGAAKDRWRGFVHRMGHVADDELARRPLSETFPEPNYQALLKDGVDRWTLSFVRAARDAIPAKPRNTRRVGAWLRAVRPLRDLCTDLLEGTVDGDGLRARISRGNDALRLRIALYEQYGHDRSLKSLKVGADRYTRMNGVRYNPAKPFWTIENRKAGIDIAEESLEAAVAALAPHQAELGASGAGRRSARFSLYRIRGEDGVLIGRKMGRDMIPLERFDTVPQARLYLSENEDALIEKFERLRQAPAERGAENRTREGVDRRNGVDVSPRLFAETFGFRGVQFGNYVEKDRRQQDLNDAYDAFMDLADVLGCPPSALSLDGTLGLAFGARGKGGKGAAMAHYEPYHVVINLTKNNGAGSLAHEWFHGLDNFLGRQMGAIDIYATARHPGDAGKAEPRHRAAITALATLSAKLRSRTEINARSKQSDRYRSSPYYTLPEEIGARSFEAWVIDQLGRRGMVNDYLANITSEEVYRAEAEILGQPPGEDRYPYPRAAEMPEIRALFGRAFAPEGALSAVLGGTEPAPFEEPGPPVVDPMAEHYPVMPPARPAPTPSDDDNVDLDDVDNEDDATLDTPPTTAPDPENIWDMDEVEF